MRARLFERLYDAVAYLDVLSEGEAVAAADSAADHLVAGFRRDPRFPKLSCAEWDLVTADARNLIADDLTQILDGAINCDAAISAIADELLEDGGSNETPPAPFPHF